MAESKNIFTAIGKLFSKNKPDEFETRQAIEAGLAAARRPSATTPVFDPNVVSNKGVAAGVFLDKGNGPVFHRYLDRETTRHMRYALYDRMDTDLVSSALDVYANEATQSGTTNKIITVTSSSKYIEEELTDLLETLGLSTYRAWPILRDMCKYGDRFGGLVLDRRRGVVGLKDFEPRSIYRIEKNGELQGYVQDLKVVNQLNADVSYSYSAHIPYIDIGSMNSMYLNNKWTSNSETESEDIIPFTKYEVAHFKLRGRELFRPYGTAVIDSAIEVWKKVDLLLDSIIIYRLNRAPSRLVFYVDVGNNQGADIENLVKKQINAINKKEFFDNRTGQLNERYQILDMNANIYIPVGKNSNTNTKVDQLDASGALGDIEDMKYLNDRLFSALKVPKAFLGFEGDVSSKGMLSQQNVTFGKSIQNIQVDFLESVKDICITHLAIRGLRGSEVANFSLNMTRPSYVEESARIDLENAKVGLASAYLGLQINKRWVMRKVFDMSEAELNEILTLDPSQQQEAMAGMGGGGMGMPAGGGLGGGDFGLGGDLGSAPPPDLNAAPTAPAPAPPTDLAAPGEPVPMTQSKEYAGSALFEGKPVTVSLDIRSKDLKLLTEQRKSGLKALFDPAPTSKPEAPRNFEEVMTEATDTSDIPLDV